MKNKLTLCAALCLLSIFAAVILFVMLEKEKNKWAYLNQQLPNCKIDTNYQIIFIDPDEKCDYIVIKKKDVYFDLNKKLNPPKVLKDKSVRFFGTGYLDSATAINYITNYNEKYNHLLQNTSIIDFESSVITKYLVDMKARNPNLNFLRIFLADYGLNPPTPNLTNKSTSILTVTTNPGGEYFPVANRETINYGGLCPPPSSYADIKNESILLGRAIDVSNTPSHSVPPGSQIIIKQ